MILRLHGLGPEVSGVARLPEDALRAKLGTSAWEVYVRLLALRDPDTLEAHPTVKGVARLRGYVRLHPVVAKKALARLRAAGLVHAKGWQWRLVKSGRGRSVRRKVYIRQVFGVRLRERSSKDRVAADYRRPDVLVVTVPRAAADWVETASGWGGSRPGSGRRKAAEKNQVVPTLQESSGTHKRYRKRSKGNGSSVERSFLKKRTRRRSGGGSSFVEDEKIGSILRSAADTSRIDPRFEIPPYPGVALVSPARVPDPPKLDPAASDLVVARALVAAYRAAAERVLGGRSHAFRRGDLSRSRYFATLVAGGRALIERGIAPAAWAAFSCDVWRRYGRAGGRGRRHPPVPWTFAPRRIVERAGWFGAEAGRWGGGRLVFGRRHLALLARHAEMRAAAARGEAPIVDAERFEREVADARAESARIERSMAERVARGEFLW